MLSVAEITNPFDPQLEVKGVEWMSLNVNSINGVVALLHPQGFEFPTLIFVDGVPVLRATWGDDLREGSRVTLIRLPTGIEAIIIAAVVIVAAVVTVALFTPQVNPAAIGAADAPGQRQNGATVYSLSGERNQNRLNSPIECAYGRNKMWPAYAARPYSVYLGNEQYQYSLFCVGQGSYNIERMFFENTAVSKFPDVEIEVVEPGESFDLFRDNVITSPEVQGIELFGSNEEEFKGYTPAFTTNPVSTIADKLQIDITLPQGLYKVDETTGELDRNAVTAQWYYRRIDDFDEPIGGWKVLKFNRNKSIVNPEPVEGEQYPNTQRTSKTVSWFQFESDTMTPQRFTMTARMDPPGRFEVRAIRLSHADQEASSADALVWESMKAFLPNREDYGLVTLIGIKARASNALNNDAGGRFNIRATRKLPVWEAGFWTNEITRNPVWAFCDVFMAAYGGRLPEEYLSLEALAALATYYDSQAITFDYIFDQRSTVWEAAKAIGRAGRSVPMLNGSRITLIRDYLKTVPTAVFGPQNMVEGSFRLSMKLRNIEEVDGTEVEYIDRDTWQPETVLALVGDDIGDNPETLRIPGITNRTKALREGLYHRATKLYNRQHVEFKTGLEGHLPKYGDLILVGHDVPKWSQTGFVTAFDGSELTLSEPVEFALATVHKIVLRKKDGSAYGPVTATATADPFVVDIGGALDAGDFNFDEIHERPIFLFGTEDLEYKQCLVTGVIPEDNDIVGIKAVIYDTRIYDGDVIVAGPRGSNKTTTEDPNNPRLPIILDYELEVRKIPGSGGDFVMVRWPAALGADHYLLDVAWDPEAPDAEPEDRWERLSLQIGTHHYRLRIQKNHQGDQLYLRVAGVNVEAGPWAYWAGQVGDVTQVPEDIDNLHLFNYGPGSLTFKWADSARADSYIVRIVDYATGQIMRKLISYERTYTYTSAMAVEDGMTGPPYVVKIFVKARNIKGYSGKAHMRETMPDDVSPDLLLTTDNAILTTDSNAPLTDSLYL